jgi:predicted ATPase/tetratricopeptide (TPR) repeat protein
MGQRALSPDACVLLGRDADLAAVRAALERERLVTVLGPPGVGKTALAERFLGTARGDYPDGAFFCDLTEAHGLEDVVRGVAAALGVQPAAPDLDAGIAQIDHVLRTRPRVLVVLDNFEQVVEQAAATLVRWLDAAEDARFLVTSRQRLRVRREHVHELASLSLPPDGDAAVALFHARARAVLGRPLEAEEDAIVEAIVRELDGLPLAIVLAAARLRVLAPAQLLAHLPRRLEVLTSSTRDAAAHHRTLREAIARSYAPLAPWEQAALRRATVFRGGFSLEAAHAVFDLAGDQDAPPTLDVLERLRDTSLLRAERAADEVRFGVYLGIRDFADAELDAAERTAASARHAAYFAGRSEAWLATASRGAPLAWLEQERDNLIAVVQRGKARDVDPRHALAALAVLEPLFIVRGPYLAYQALLDGALDAADTSSLPSGLLARVYGARGRVRSLLGHVVEAEADLRQGIALAARAGEHLLQGRLLGVIGFTLYRDEPDRARLAYAEALACVESSGDPVALGDHLSLVGTFQRAQGDLPAAREALERARELLATCEPRTFARALANLGLVYLDEQRLEEALATLVHAHDLFAQLADRYGTGNNRGNVACVLQELGRLDEALTAYDESLAELAAIGARPSEGVFRMLRATLLHERGDLADACAAYEHAASVLGATGQGRDEGHALGYLGAALAALGRGDPALDALDRARRRLTDAHDPVGLAALDLHHGHIDRIAGREAEVAGRLAAAAPHAARSYRVRVAVRLLARCPARPASGIELVVGPGAAWFRLGARERVDLGRRAVLRRVVLALVEARDRAPGRELRTADLLSAGWPSERLPKELGANRVHVAMGTLRRLGLEQAIVRSRGGWLLDPAIGLVLSQRTT